MTPNLRRDRTRSARALAASQPVNATTPSTTGTTKRTSNRGSNTQPRTVSFRSRSAKASNAATPASPSEGGSSPPNSTATESPSQGRGDAPNRPPPSAQPAPNSEAVNEHDERVEEAAEEDKLEDWESYAIREGSLFKSFHYQKIDFDIKHDVFLGKEWMFARITP